MIDASLGAVIVIWLVATEPEDRPEKFCLLVGDMSNMFGEPPSVYAASIAASIFAKVNEAAVPVRSAASEPSPVAAAISAGLHQHW